MRLPRDESRVFHRPLHRWTYRALRHREAPIQLLRPHSLGCVPRLLLGVLAVPESYLAVVRPRIHRRRRSIQPTFPVSLSAFYLAGS